MRLAFGGNPQGSIRSQRYRLGVEVSIGERLTSLVAQGDDLERSNGRTVELELQRVDPGRGNITAVIGERVEKAASGVVGQTRETTEWDLLIDQIDRQLELGDDRSHRHLNRKHGHRHDQRDETNDQTREDQVEMSVTRERARARRASPARPRRWLLDRGNRQRPWRCPWSWS